LAEDIMDDATGTPSRIRPPEEAMITLVDSVSLLAKLMADEALVEEKVQASQVALAAIKKRISESLVQSYITHGTNIDMPEDLMSQEQYYERLLLALQEMKREIAQKIRPLELQIIEANREHLRETFEECSHRLAHCLIAVDEHILACRQHLDEYNSIRSDLHNLNDKLSQLGAVPLDVPSRPSGGDLGELIRSRLDHLRSHGKI
jgi:predicted hydrolase (HD superfamily)